MQEFFSFLESNWFEILAAILGIIAVFLQIKQNIFFWIVTVANTLMYIWVYMSQKLYALMFLMIYYIIISLFGIYNWKRKKQKNNEELKISTIKLKSWLYIILGMFAAFISIFFILKTFTNSANPLLDGLVTTLSFSAIWMLANKKIENWIVWFISDMISCGLYIQQKMYPTLALYIVLVIMAVIGFFEWRKNLRHG
ncbi:MAG: nicotinamide mononucleotide transporter [Bacteroidales bacterium]|nr:nicotinamide mononucleotide transporter [Bacteroidales bacterium]